MTPERQTCPTEHTADGACYRFGRFELFPVQRSLQLEHREVCVTPRAFDLLLALVERAGRLVGKNELLDLVWPKVVVEENSLQVLISALRKIVGWQAIVTVPGRGYQFTLLPSDIPISSTHVISPAVKTTVGGATTTVGNLPAQLPPLYGRVEDSAALAHLIELHPIVAVVGPGGIGKTRLAQAVACALSKDYEDGSWFAELAPLSTTDQVVPTVARALGLAPMPPDTALDALIDALRNKHMLLVLDNCEHLLSAVCDLAARIAGDAPGIRVLVTSQEPLKAPNEGIHRLQALAVPTAADFSTALHFGAVELFVARAQAADPRLALDASSVGAIVEICTRLDGMPLAVELAAARVPLLGVHGVRQRLDERFRLLVGGGVRTALARHQTLRATLQWSYALLGSDERKVLNRLAVFVGSFGLDAAQLTASDDTIDSWAVIDHLAALVDKSWVLVDSGEALRYRMLESSRAFALERLEEGGLEQARRRHAQAIADTLVEGDTIESAGTRIQRISPDLDNARTAVAWATGPQGDADISVALAGATHLLWEAQGCNEEGDRLHCTVGPWVTDRTPPRLAARFWFAVSNLGLFAGLNRQADAGLRAANLFRGLGDRYWLFRSLLSAAQKMSWAGSRATAETALSECRQLLDPDWPPCTRAYLEHGLGIFEYFTAQNPGDARRHFLAAGEIGRHSYKDGFIEDAADIFLVSIDYALGDLVNAVGTGLKTLRRPINRMGVRNRTILCGTIGAALAGVGRLNEADDMLRITIPQAKRALGSTTWVFNHVAFLVARQGRYSDAAQLLGYIDAAPTKGVIAKSPSQARSHAQALGVTHTALDTDAFQALHAAGGYLSESEATTLAFPAK